MFVILILVILFHNAACNVLFRYLIFIFWCVNQLSYFIEEIMIHSRKDSLFFISFNIRHQCDELVTNVK